ncbi:MAG: hypothetical protein HZC17_05460, partial [Candidatus Omnitrophica bacterium]|nr:hypothetical protein [Candidatus Omnitrophota bacterium]
MEDLFVPQDQSKNSPFVYLIQDAHDSLDAQESIRNILRQLVDKEGVELVCFEGGSLKLDRSFYDFAHNPKLNIKVWDSLFQQGEIGGLERYALQSPEKIQFYGIEDESVYFKNVHALQSVYAGEETARLTIRSIDSRFAQEWGRLITGELKKFLDSRNAFQERKIPLNQYADELSKWAKKIAHLDLLDSSSQNNWPQLVRLLKLREFEARLKKNEEQIQEELKAVQEKSKNSPVNFVWDLSRHVRVKGHLRWYFERTVDELRAKGVALDLFPHLKDWIGFHVLQDELEAKPLFDEIENFEKIILDHMNLSAEIRNFLVREHQWILTKKLIRLELTRKEWREVKVKDFSFDGLDSLIELARRNYELVERRDQILSNRFADRIKRMNAKKAAVIVGGFHADELAAFLKQNKLSYEVINPTIRNLDRKLNYRARMNPEIKNNLPDPLANQVALAIAGSLGSPEGAPFKLDLQRKAMRVTEKMKEQSIQLTSGASLGKKSEDEKAEDVTPSEAEKKIPDSLDQKGKAFTDWIKLPFAEIEMGAERTAGPFFTEDGKGLVFETGQTSSDSVWVNLENPEDIKRFPGQNIKDLSIPLAGVKKKIQIGYQRYRRALIFGDAEKGSEIKRIKGAELTEVVRVPRGPHTAVYYENFYSCAFNDQETLLAVYSEFKDSILLTSSSRGEKIKIYAFDSLKKNHEFSVLGVRQYKNFSENIMALNSDGSQLAALTTSAINGLGQDIYLFETASGKPWRILKIPATHSITGIRFSPDNRYLLAVTRASTKEGAAGSEKIYLYDLKNLEDIQPVSMKRDLDPDFKAKEIEKFRKDKESALRKAHILMFVSPFVILLGIALYLIYLPQIGSNEIRLYTMIVLLGVAAFFWGHISVDDTKIGMEKTDEELGHEVWGRWAQFMSPEAIQRIIDAQNRLM